MEQGATISQDGKYRYDLWRIWDDSLKELVFVMLNPSTADADVDDPTILRCIDIAKYLKYGGMYVVNVFAFRSTDPEKLRGVADPFGPENKIYLQNAAKRSDKIICAWGSECSTKLKSLSSKLVVAKKALRESGAKTFALKENADGEPHHVLFLATKYCYHPLPYTV